jgi:integrase/recombinase XerD
VFTTKLAQLWPIYKRDKTIARFSQLTLKGYEIQFNLLSRVVGDVDAEEVTIDVIKDYLAGCTHLKIASLAGRVRFIKAFFTWAFTEKYISANPTSGIKEPRNRDKKPKYLSEEEILKLKDGCESLTEKTILEFSFATGCRVGEIANINRAAINWDNNSIDIMGKGNKRRIIYFSEPCKEILREYLAQRKDDDEALIVTERAPHRMSVAEMRYILKRIAKRAGMANNVYPHKLRHTYATHLLNNGASLEAIRQLLGHCNLSSTMMYANLTEEGKQNTYTRCFKG